MNRKKQIEEIAEIINKRVDTNLGQLHGTKSGFGKCADVTTTVGTTLVAKELYDNGYRKIDEIKKQVAKEILNALNRTPHEYHEKKIGELAKSYGIKIQE